MTPVVFDSRADASMPGAQRLPGKIAFLSEPAAYREGTSAVRALETHLSWVFLTDTHAYKLKKPLRHDDCDLTTVAARAAHCRMEIVLNRRLTQDVYLGPVPLAVDRAGRLQLDRGGVVIDWLIRMRRLPAERMLDRLIEAHRLREADLHAALVLLVRFYRAQPAERVDGAEWRAHFAARIERNVRELAAPDSHLPARMVEDLGERQLAALERHAARFDARVAAGRVVEGHGDLRPEHVCLDRTPQVIDCLEFSRALRVVDTAEELGFLALECERLGAPRLRREIFDAYGELSGDRPSAPVVDFYQSHHALVRARLALARVREEQTAQPEHWIRRARQYLDLALAHIGPCA